jgi:hypothetical protein
VTWKQREIIFLWVPTCHHKYFSVIIWRAPYAVLLCVSGKNLVKVFCLFIRY